MRLTYRLHNNLIRFIDFVDLEHLFLILLTPELSS